MIKMNLPPRLAVRGSQLETLTHQMSPEDLAEAVRFLFWAIHEANPDLAQSVLREIAVDWDERYGWLGGTD